MITDTTQDFKYFSEISGYFKSNKYPGVYLKIFGNKAFNAITFSGLTDNFEKEDLVYPVEVEITVRPKEII